jgi:Actinobacteria/chloroflexi VLRF1 release factor
VTDQQAGPAGPADPADGFDDVPADPAEGFGDVPADARRVTVGFDRMERWLAGVVARHGPQQWTATPTLLRARAEDGTRLWIEVPFPPLATPAAPTSAHAPAVDPTRADPVAAFLAHLATPRRIGLLLVRRGGYGVGVFQGSELVASKVGSSYVQGTTKAGGWSQQRFARRRDNQARSAFATAADEVARVVLPEAARLDALVCGGDRAAVDTVLEDPRLLALRAKRSGPWLAVPDPRRAVVLQAPKQFLAVSIRIHP